MMTEKERLHRILAGYEADRPACICPGGMMNMITAELMKEIDIYLPAAHENAEQMTSLARAVYTEGCFENCGVPFCMTVEAENLGAPVVLGTDIVEPHVASYVLQELEQFVELPGFDVEKGRAKVVLESLANLKKDGTIPVIGNLTGPISTATSLIEPTVFYRALRKKKELVHAYMKYITDQLIVFGKAMIEAGADVIAISDPSGTGEILGPNYFREFAVPYLNRLIHALRKDGVGIIVHICGRMGNVYQELNCVEADALSFDSVVSMKEAKEQLPNRVLMGNVSTYALEYGSVDKVRTLVQCCLEQGADIISPACGLGMRSPLENVRALLDCVKKG